MSCVSFFSDVSMVTGKEMAAMQSLCEKRWKHIPAELANKEIILSPIEFFLMISQRIMRLDATISFTMLGSLELLKTKSIASWTK